MQREWRQQLSTAKQIVLHALYREHTVQRAVPAVLARERLDPVASGRSALSLMISIPSVAASNPVRRQGHHTPLRAPHNFAQLCLKGDSQQQQHKAD